jgi:hypothetical protein
MHRGFSYQGAYQRCGNLFGLLAYVNDKLELYTRRSIYSYIVDISTFMCLYECICLFKHPRASSKNIYDPKKILEPFSGDLLARQLFYLTIILSSEI